MKKVVKLMIGPLLLINLLILFVVTYPLPSPFVQLSSVEPLKIYDRHGALLYEDIKSEKGRQTPIDLNQVPTQVIQAFIAIEDQRFYDHGGVDLKAILRAVWQNISAQRIVSGGSTITQQVVRNLVGTEQGRSFFQKAKESIIALKVSKLHSKDKILETYLNTIYFGGSAYGIEAASWQYFNKSARHLDLAEATFLAGLPQSPNRYYPYKHFERAKKRQKDVLIAMENIGFIDGEEKKFADEEVIQLKSKNTTKKAPHFVDFIIENKKEASKIIHTTLDLGLQEKVAQILEGDLSFLRQFNIQNGTVVILDTEKGDILAMVGSKDYYNASIDGEVNVATSLRQPGSTIKPLIYALALEKGWKIDSIINDEPISFKTSDGFSYTPQNYDLTYRGKVTLAEALAQSLNIPAVKALDFIGVQSLLNKASSFGISTFTENAEHYGLSIGLGSAEVKLLELTNAYSSFANKGHRPQIKWNQDEPTKSLKVIQENTANDITNILSNNNWRAGAFGEENPLNFPFRVAAKTGTTRNFKDNWTIGYTNKYAVGVWVGNSNGSVMEGVSGISGAAPIFNKIIYLLHQNEPIKFQSKESGINAPKKTIEPHDSDEIFRITSPFSNDVFLFDKASSEENQKIKLSATKSAQWIINGEPIGSGKSILWNLKRGNHKIKAIYNGDVREVKITVK